MAQNFTDDCFDASHVGQTDLQNMENNFACLKSSFSGTSAPSNPVAGMLWYDTTNNLLKLRNAANNGWLEIYDFGNDRVASGKVKTASLADGALTADAAGRGKMADGYITNAKVTSVGGSKITAGSIPSGKFQAGAIAGADIADGTITPSKLSAGSGTLLTWSGGPSSLEIDAEGNLATGIYNYNTDGSTFLAFWKGYMYIPSGAKYVILGVRGQAVGANAYVRVVVGSTGGSTATLKGAAGFMSAAGGQLDISGEAGGWKLVQLQVVGASGSSGSTSQINIVGVTVQWYGA